MKSPLRWIIWLLLGFAVLYTGGHLSYVADAPSPPTTYWVNDIHAGETDPLDVTRSSRSRVTVALGYEGPHPVASSVAQLFDLVLVTDDPTRPVRFDNPPIKTETAMDTTRREIRLTFAVTQDGNRVVAVSADTHLYSMDPRDPGHVLEHRELVPDRKRDTFRQAAISIDDDRLVTFTREAESVQLWSLSRMNEIASANLKHLKTGPWSGCTFSHTTCKFALAHSHGDVIIWNIDTTEEELRVADLPGMDRSIGPIAFSHDGTVLAVTDANQRQIYLLGVSTGEVLMRCPPLADRGPGSTHVDAICFSKTGKLLIIQSALFSRATSGAPVLRRVATVWDLHRIRSIQDQLRRQT